MRQGIPRKPIRDGPLETYGGGGEGRAKYKKNIRAMENLTKQNIHAMT